MKVIGHDSGLPQGNTGSFPKTSLDTVAVLYVNYSARHKGKKSPRKCGNGRLLNNKVTQFVTRKRSIQESCGIYNISI